MYFKLLLVFSVICVITAGQVQSPSMELYCVDCNVTWNSVCPSGPYTSCITFSNRTIPMCVQYKQTKANGQSFLIKGCGFENLYLNKRACEEVRFFDDKITECQQCATPYCNYRFNRY